MTWEGSCCFVTGGTSGIGRAIVEALAAEKARVFTCAISKEEVDTALKEWQSEGYDIHACACDLSKKEDLEALIDQIDRLRAFFLQVSRCFGGKLHTFVSNAGILISKKAVEHTDEEYDKLMLTNLRPSFALCRLCYPLLKRSAPSSVVFIGSNLTSRAVVDTAVYSMAKASLKQLTMNLACEWAPDQIRVNCVAPGPTRTPMTRHIQENKALYDAFMAEIPMRRMAEPEEIASAVLFFSGSGASFVTGQYFYVDGGFSIRGLGI